MEQEARKVHTTAFERVVTAKVAQGWRVAHMTAEDNHVFLIFEKHVDTTWVTV